ncbi:MAG: hypothetical protein K9K67_04205 [Bacteriovoracaceae bacterium]|nr:hypothetical protein [Bacteriovoracaceae bacterium]
MNNLLRAPLGNISQSVWRNALVSYLSQCVGECPCALVVSEGIQGDINSANMWIGTFKDGQPTELWSGLASRLASGDQNRENVSMPTDRCKRRNGVAEVRGNQACIPQRSCRDVSVYRSLADELGLPENVALTSFYFSTPMQNEMYKFHDFYPCTSTPCPATLGCLGLERHAMKALCLNHMGSNGSNGIEAPERAGGVWLYFHNTGRPNQNPGDEDSAFAGYRSLAQNGKCSNVSTANLSSGELMSPSSILASGGGRTTSGRSPSSSNGGGLLQGFNQLAGLGQQQGQERGEEQALSPQQEQFQRAIRRECNQTTAEACPNVSESIINEYCEDVRRFTRNACEFERKD